MTVRIHVIGLPGSGKTTLARRLAERLGIEHVELDALFHQPNWTERPDAEFRSDVAARVSGPAWVVDGNYRVAREVLWAYVDTIVWLDLQRRVVFPSLLGRTLGRAWHRTELWNGNRERPSNMLSWRKERNLLLWAWHKWPSHQQRFGSLQIQPPRPGVEVVRLRDRWQVDALVEQAPLRLRRATTGS